MLLDIIVEEEAEVLAQSTNYGVYVFGVIVLILLVCLIVGVVKKKK